MSLIPVIGAAQKFNRPRGLAIAQYQIERSLRFRSSASAYLNRTPASAGNRRTWTWSGWAKISTTGPWFTFLTAFNGGSQYTNFGYRNDTQVLRVVQDNGAGGVYNLESVAKFRDPSAWYHFVVAFDTTQATDSNRIKLYVNGVQLAVSGSYPGQNTDSWINITNTHYLGGWPTVSEFLDGYMTEINFVDGQALTPSDFGEFNTQTGVWQPKAYESTYGTNGFYLNFSDNASTSALGTDFSGNNNTWTTNNISLTAGATFDSMIDTPTPFDDGGHERGNYCTLNPLSPTPFGSLSNGNLQFTGATDWGGSKSTFSIPRTGKWYAEFTLGATTSNSAQADVGIWPDGNPNGNAWAGSYGLEVNNGFFLLTNGSYSSDRGGTTAAGSVFQIAVDADAGTVWFGVNNAWYNTFNTTNGNPSAGTNPSGSSINFSATQFFMGVKTDFNNWAANFGQRPFTYTPPTGFKALNTQNLPEPTIVNGGEYFNAVLWNGTGASQNITTVGFAPDWVWIKSRSNATNHYLYDIIRGTNNQLITNSTEAESTVADRMTAFNNNGFTVGSSNEVNGSGRTYVGWNWRASNTTPVTNTDGSITSTVSANPTAGFSIVTYTGNATSGATVGHGLGVAPSFIIGKSRTQSAVDWPTFHVGTGNNGGCTLNESAAKVTTAGWWNNTTPSSTVVTLGNGAQTNGSGQSMLLYCFSEVAGYSKFGSYTGNGSADGPFVYTGFRPAWVLTKKISGAATEWELSDTKRNPTNGPFVGLIPNQSDAENSYSPPRYDVLSNGFKIRSSGGGINENGETWIYAAFSEAAFKYALAR